MSVRHQRHLLTLYVSTYSIVCTQGDAEVTVCALQTILSDRSEVCVSEESYDRCDEVDNVSKC